MHQNRDYNILLNKLISGTITEEEKWTLERASLDDPFLADAIEGVYNNDEDVDVVLSLDRSIRKITWYKSIAVAASLILLLGFSFLIIQNSQTDNLDTIAESEATISNPETTILSEAVPEMEKAESTPESVALTAQNEVNQAQKIKSEKQIVKQKEIIETVSRTSTEKYKSNTSSIEEGLTEEPILAMTEDLETYDVADESMTKPVSRSKKRLAEVYEVPLLDQQVIKGHVYDQGGIPISKAVVINESYTDSSITDNNGFFALEVGDEDRSVLVKSQGFTPQDLAVKPELSITLEKAQSSFSQEPMLLVETMSIDELKLEYARILDNQLRSPFSICPQEKPTFNKIKLRIHISEVGELISLDFITNLSENCQRVIEDKIMQISLENTFKGKEAVVFYYNLRL